MSNGFDLRVYKRTQRDRYRSRRRSFSAAEKAEKDRRILGRVLSSGAYRRSRVLLCYVSTPEEVDTRALIQRALADGKQVAVPYCIAGTRNMEFYKINSLEELVPRTFGVLEPVAREETRLTDFRSSVCILPGIAFDSYGYRLGYGGGYYDRFLSHHYKGVKIGVCYEECFLSRLSHGRYDVACDLIVTDRTVRKAVRQSPPSKRPPRRRGHSGAGRKYGGLHRGQEKEARKE